MSNLPQTKEEWLRRIEEIARRVAHQEVHSLEQITRHKELLIVAISFYDLMVLIQSTPENELLHRIKEFSGAHQENAETKINFYREIREKPEKH